MPSLEVPKHILTFLLLYLAIRIYRETSRYVIFSINLFPQYPSMIGIVHSFAQRLQTKGETDIKAGK